MQQAHRLFSEEICSSNPARVDFSFRHTQLELSDLTRTVKASFLRSKSLHDRIHNEINLVSSYTRFIAMLVPAHTQCRHTISSIKETAP